MVVLHSLRPADVAAFSVGTFCAYSTAEASDGSSRIRDGRVMEDDRSARLDSWEASSSFRIIAGSSWLLLF